MGTYTIIVEAHGINHNGTPKDADEMGKALVAALRASGHTEVKGYFVYGPKLATSIVEATMESGFGARRAEPLLPMCVQGTWHPDSRGGWNEPCPSQAVEAIVDERQRIVTVRCAAHQAYTHESQPLPDNCRRMPL